MQIHPRLRQLVRALTGSRSGNTAIEFAFIAPAMLMFIFGVAEVGRVLWLQNALDYSVVEAARCMSNSPSKCDNATDTATFFYDQAGAGFLSSDTTLTVTAASCGNQVTASHQVPIAIPYMNLSPINLTSQACYPT
jgi:Flp pilus assembly protein TadG